MYQSLPSILPSFNIFFSDLTIYCNSHKIWSIFNLLEYPNSLVLFTRVYSFNDVKFIIINHVLYLDLFFKRFIFVNDYVLFKFYFARRNVEVPLLTLIEIWGECSHDFVGSCQHVQLCLELIRGNLSFQVLLLCQNFLEIWVQRSGLHDFTDKLLQRDEYEHDNHRHRRGEWARVEKRPSHWLDCFRF